MKISGAVLHGIAAALAARLVVVLAAPSPIAAASATAAPSATASPRDLPATRETLLLRLMGASQVLNGAVAELRALPADAWEPRELLPLLLAYRVQIDQDPLTSSEDDMGYADELQGIYDDWERRVRQQSEERGIEKGMRELLAGTYEARFGAMPGELRAALDATTDVATLRRWGPLFATAPAGEIAAAVLAAARS